MIKTLRIATPWKGTNSSKHAVNVQSPIRMTESVRQGRHRSRIKVSCRKLAGNRDFTANRNTPAQPPTPETTSVHIRGQVFEVDRDGLPVVQGDDRAIGRRLN